MAIGFVHDAVARALSNSVELLSNSARTQTACASDHAPGWGVGL